jgi:hypothetical protein
MSVNHTVVPRINLAELAAWNAAQEHAKAAYDHDPHAAGRASASAQIAAWWRRARYAALPEEMDDVTADHLWLLADLRDTYGPEQ